MKTFYSFLAAIFLFATAADSQMTIGASTAPNAASVLDLSNATTLGLYPPQVALTGTNAAGPITNPPTSLLVYNTATAGTSPNNVTPGYYYNAGTSSAPNWTRLFAGNNNSADAWLTSGNAGTKPTTNFIGTTDNNDLVFKINNKFSGEIDDVNSNLFLGYQAGLNNTGTANSFLGYDAGMTNSAGSNNTALGNVALANNTIATLNTAIGSNSLPANLAASRNTSIGYGSLFTQSYNNGGTAFNSDNTALGYEALYANQPTASSNGIQNIAVGSNALSANTTGAGNTAIGYNTGLANTTGTYNTFVGYSANAGSAALTNATAIGYSAVVGSSNSLILGGTGANAVNVGIGTTTPNAAAILDLSGSGTLGIYPTQVALTATNAAAPLTNPPTSLMVYNTATAGTSPNNVIPGYYYNSGTPAAPNWVMVLAGNNNFSTSWLTLGNGGTNTSINFIGTTDANGLKFKVNNTLAGYIDPSTDVTTFGRSAGDVGTTTVTGITAFGANALKKNTSGGNNTAIGDDAMESNTTGASNTVMGYSAMFNNTVGGSNTAIGFEGLVGNSSGSSNTAVGYGTLFTQSYSNSGTSYNAYNTAIGFEALFANQPTLSTNGINNTGVGTLSLSTNTTGVGNTAIGYLSGTTNTTGSNNTFLGYASNVSSAALSNATAVGYSATVGASNSLVLGGTGANGVNVGIRTTTPNAAAILDLSGGTTLGLYPTQVALTATNAAAPLTAPPTSLLVYNTATAGTSPNNVVPGYYYNAGTSAAPNWLMISAGNGSSGTSWITLGNAGTTPTTNFLGTTDNNGLKFKVNNILGGYIDPTTDVTTFGRYAGNVGVTTATGVTAFGSNALKANTNGVNNAAFGDNAMEANTSGGANVALGTFALSSNSTTSNNTAIGYVALTSNTGSNNTALGSQSLYSNTSGSNNTAVGLSGLLNNTTGNNNTSIGYASLNTQSFSNGGTAYSANNTAVGFESLFANQPTSTSNGVQNTAVGTISLIANTTGAGNTAIGYSTGGTNTTGTNNTFLGFSADASGAALTNATAIGANAVVGASNSLVLGGTGANAVNVGIRTTTPNAAAILDLSGGTTLGLYPTQVALTATNAAAPLTAPPTSLLVYNTATAGTSPNNVTPGYYYNAGTAATPNWVMMSAGNNNGSTSWLTLGNAGTTPGTNFLGTTDNKGLEFKVFNTLGGYIDPTTDVTTFGRSAGNVGVTTATGVTAFGTSALKANTNGVNNAAIGDNAMAANTSAGQNTSLGYQTLYTQSFANGGTAFSTNNTAIGYQALYSNQPTAASNGINNTAVGTVALVNNTTGTGNTAIGSSTGGNNATGTNNTFIGFSANAGGLALSNATAIGANAVVSASNALVLGGTGANAVNVGIQTATPNAAAILDLSGGTTLGLYPTQVALTATNAAAPLTNPPTSLLVYNTATAGSSPNNVVPGYYYNSGTAAAPNWVMLSAGNNSSSTSWLTTGNAGTTAGTNFIGTTGSTDFVTKTASTERMRVFAGGGVGIGTTAQLGNALLSLAAGSGNTALSTDNNSNWQAANSGSTYEFFLTPRGGDNFTYMNYGSAGMNLRTDGSLSTLYMTNSNQVGVNMGGSTTANPSVTPSAILEVAGNNLETNTAYEALIKLDASTTTSSPFTRTPIGAIYHSYNSTAAASYVGIESYDVSSYLNKRAFAINEFGGNVGIGTSNPTTTLHIRNYLGGNTFFNIDNTAGGTDQSGINFLGGGSLKGNMYFDPTTATYGANGAVLINNIGTTSTPNTILNLLGSYVGIGIAAPTTILHIKASTSMGNSFVNIDNSVAADQSGINFLGTGTLKSNIYFDPTTATYGTNGALLLNNVGSTSPNTILNLQGGNVGMGTALTNAAAELDMSGVTTKGIYPTQVSLTATNAAGPLTNPPTSLLVYNKATAGASPYNVTPGYYYNAGTAAAPNWVMLSAGNSSSSTSWLTLGNAGTTPGTNFIGTTDVNALEFKVDNILAGDLDPTNNIAVFGRSAGNIGTTTATSITAFGAAALKSNTTGTGNIAVGDNALAANINGNTNTANGYQALYSNTTGYSNVALGTNALYNNSINNNTVAVGDSALYNNGTGPVIVGGGTSNTAVGSKALFTNSNGFANTATGFHALFDNSTGYFNTANGMYALNTNSGGYSNVAVGYYALYSNMSGNANTATGAYALQANTGSSNTAFGWEALFDNGTGYDNTATGYGALDQTGAGHDNTANGISALNLNSSGSYNTASGMQALATNSTGSYITAYGTSADVNANNYSNTSMFGYQAMGTATNQVRVGNGSVTSIGGYAGWTNISDGRVKKNIQQNVPGLAFISLLHPITYTLDLDAADAIVQPPVRKDKDGNLILPSQEELDARKAKEQVVYTGFIAQDVEAAAKSLGYDFSGVDAAKNSKDLYGLRYADFVVPLVKAVQEQQATLQQQQLSIEELKKIIEQQQKQIDELKALIKPK